MAVPVLDEVVFPKKPATMPVKKGDKVTITIKKGSGFKKGDRVKVIAHSGVKPIVWEGKVGTPNPDGTWPVEVHVEHEKKRAADEKDRGTEDVSTTVTNSDTPPADSQPLITTGVPVP